MHDIEIRRINRNDRDWLIAQHADHYAREEGFDASFGILVAQIVDDFLAHHDPNREAGWIATQGGTRIGSIFCVSLDPNTAKLRLFLLVPKARGTGLGKRLLKTCMGFAKDCGYARMQLWTHESHRAAGGLYRATGWSLGETKSVHSFGKDNVEQIWRIDL